MVEAELPELGPISIRSMDAKDMSSCDMSSEKIREKLDFSPKKTLEDALREVALAIKGGHYRDSMTNTAYHSAMCVKESKLY